ncbi:phosphoenolpyruvate--protein phosphotransferase [Saccharophagus degradans]|uniref:phosphoenolpyruvate--protein phosphotransferase n=1 Tax=Saccharophagus degradans TaxID=86304 RepID=A0AAW7X741_9GAMM|nr:phosphoenolpyruvate--protein phosphotransferase [Saccharophagus degradans]MDO6423422.1 phosphoenolpyruvate--protein phosphotransferase [Saccharophagus degradans]MDO6606827.1 phosphoenolpyruvate--protein phosphotransferase [Saccharophagus degradans]
MLNDLRSIVQEVYAATDLSSVLEIIVRRVKSAMNTEVCSVYLRNETGAYTLMATDGLNREAVGRVTLAKNEGLVGLVAAREEPINLDDAESHPKYQYFAETGEERFSAFLGTPIIHQRQVMGVLVVQQAAKRRFDEGEEAFLITMSAQLAGVIAHAEATGTLRAMGSKSAVRFNGVPGASGVAIGECVVVSPVADLNAVPYATCDNIEEELAFFSRSLAAVREDVKRLGQSLENLLNKEERVLFDAYLGMLDDTSLAREVTEKISMGLAAPYAWSEVILDHVKTFSAMPDAYLRERASDVRDLGSRVLAYLQETTQKELVYPEKTILVGEDLTPSMLAEVPVGQLAGLVSVRGSSNSHIAILARSMGIPTIMGAVDLPFTKLNGREMVVDGYRGSVYIDPGEALLQSYQAILEEDLQLVAGLQSIKNLPCETSDHHRVALWVNTGLLADTMLSIERGAEGVGLYRTEVPFMLRDRFPSEEEQRLVYREQLEAFAPHPVTMRTLDVGGDKSLPYFPIEEENPFLGWRGIRVTLDHPEIFLGQVRAMLKASVGLDNLRIMLPMITNIAEVEIAQMLIHRAYDELLEEGYDVQMPPLGVMIEVPAAVYQAKELAARVDFISVGSNDLTQYLLAVDRNNPRVADLYHPLHPAVLRALRKIVKDAHSQGVPVSICGELAGEPAAALLLVAMGYDVLSMNATNLLKVKSVVRAVTLEQAETLLAEVMSLPDAESINRCLEAAFRHAGLNRMLRPDLGDDANI